MLTFETFNGSILMERGKLFILSTLVGAIVAAGWTALSRGEGEKRLPAYQSDRKHLPDFSQGTAGLLGPFYWGRAVDLGEDARFSDPKGRPDRDGEHLWLYQYCRRPHKALNNLIFARNNLIARSKGLAFTVQPKHMILNTPGAHNLKIIFGYVREDFRFLHGDNCDLAHLANTPRLLVFMPIRHGHVARDFDPLDQSIYHANTTYSAQSPCIVEFAPKEMIRYGYFADPNDLDDRILYDLRPHFTGRNALKPGVTHPMMQLDIANDGGWRFRLERDGRDGLAGGDNADGWDLVVTNESQGAKPYSVKLSPSGSRWAMSVFSPGGAPMETSEVLLKLAPYDRATGKTAKWPSRHRRIRSAAINQIERAAQQE
jgi:hypothetical protein